MLAVLIVSGGIINAWERAGEASVSRKPLKEFPKQVGSWRQQGDEYRASMQERQRHKTGRKARLRNKVEIVAADEAG